VSCCLVILIGVVVVAMRDLWLYSLDGEVRRALLESTGGECVGDKCWMVDSEDGRRYECVWVGRDQVRSMLPVGVGGVGELGLGFHLDFRREDSRMAWKYQERLRNKVLASRVGV